MAARNCSKSAGEVLRQCGLEQLLRTGGAMALSPSLGHARRLRWSAHAVLCATGQPMPTSLRMALKAPAMARSAAASIAAAPRQRVRPLPLGPRGPRVSRCAATFVRRHVCCLITDPRVLCFSIPHVPSLFPFRSGGPAGSAGPVLDCDAHREVAVNDRSAHLHLQAGVPARERRDGVAGDPTTLSQGRALKRGF